MTKQIKKLARNLAGVEPMENNQSEHSTWLSSVTAVAMGLFTKPEKQEDFKAACRFDYWAHKGVLPTL